MWRGRDIDRKMEIEGARARKTIGREADRKV